MDEIVERSCVGSPAPLIDDGAFARRTALVLTGTIPEGAEVRAFLAALDQAKREALVERYLNAPSFVEHLAEQFDVLLMERRPEKHAKQEAWRTYLVEAFQQRKPLDVLAREILSADGKEGPLQPASRFLLDRDADPHRLTRDAGRVFLGIDLQCAQCHDHPRVDDYTQRDYYGLHAFFGRTFLFQPDLNAPGKLAERGEGESTFQSVFTEHASATGPRLPGGPEFVEEAVSPGEEYVAVLVPSNGGLPPEPRTSRRALLGDALLERAEDQFARNFANRLWAMIMGRALVEPVDLHHSSNPPANPELLEILASSLRDGGYDVRAFARELVLTKTFQRALDAGQDGGNIPEHAVGSLEKEASRLAAEATTRWKEARDRLEAVETELKPAFDQWEGASAALREAVKHRNAASEAREQAEAESAAKGELLELLATAAQSAGAASEALRDLEGLDEAAEALRARAAQAEQEQTAAGQTLQERAAALAAKESERESEAAKREALQPQHAEMRARLAEARQVYLDAERQRREADLAHASARAEVERLAKLKELQGARRARSQAEAKLERISHARVLVAEAVTGLERLAEEQLSIASARREWIAQSESETLRLTKRHEELRNGAPIVEQALRDSEAVRERLPEDPALQTAEQRLRAALAKLARESADAEERLAAGQDAAAGWDEAGRASDEAAASATTRMALLRERAAESERDEEAARTALQEAEKTQAALEMDVLALRERTFAVARLTPLTPEQLCRSMMQSTGYLALQRAAAEAEYDAAQSAPQESPAGLDERGAAVEAALREKIRVPESEFIRLFGGGAGQPQGDFFATVDQALFFSNGGTVRGWLAPGNGNLTERLLKMDDSAALAIELYLCMFSRLPEEEEIREIQAYLQRRAEARSQAVEELCWALLTSTEFRFHH